MRIRLLAAAALATAAVTTAAPAANAACFGTERTVLVCVNSNGLPTVDTSNTYEDCAYVLPGKPCIPIEVPIPSVQPGSGELVTVTCNGPFTCS